jgi:hypothetical protein
MAMRALTPSLGGVLEWMKQPHSRFLPQCFSRTMSSPFYAQLWQTEVASI